MEEVSDILSENEQVASSVECGDGNEDTTSPVLYDYLARFGL